MDEVAVNPAASAMPDDRGRATGTASAALEFRRFPYPYKAMAAVCSDLDETPDAATYLDIARFLNTTETTRSGPGVGLEVGNSLYFDMPPGQFAYWNTDETGRAMARALIQSGHVDCIHSFGDLANSRRHAARALDEMAAHGCRPEVWIDHATAPSNFGSDIMKGFGDVPDSQVYHADLTLSFGVRYVWRGRVTSVIGQDLPRSLAGIAEWRCPLHSARTLAKEWLKGRLGALGQGKYAMHGPNNLCRSAKLRDGQEIVEFIRCNPCFAGVQRMDDAEGIGRWLSRRVLDCLVHRGGFAVFYTHLGKIRTTEQPFGPATRQAFGTLAEFATEGRILVATTRRLLGYRTTLAFLESGRREPSQGNGHEIASHGVLDVCPFRISGEVVELFPKGWPFPLRPEDADGLTFYWPSHRGLRLCVAGQEIVNFCRNPEDESGKASVSIPWRRLSFPNVPL